jgi:hypothetical protein
MYCFDDCGFPFARKALKIGLNASILNVRVKPFAESGGVFRRQKEKDDESESFGKTDM